MSKKIIIENVISEGRVSKFIGGFIAKLIKGKVKRIIINEPGGKELAKKINELQAKIQEVDNFLQKPVPGRKDGKSYEDLFRERGV